MANLFIAMGGSGLKTVREIREKNREVFRQLIFR